MEVCLKECTGWLMLMMLTAICRLKKGTGWLMLMMLAGLCREGVSEGMCRAADAHDAGWGVAIGREGGG